MNDRRYHDDQPGAWIWNVISKVAMWVLFIVIVVAFGMWTFGVPGCALKGYESRRQQETKQESEQDAKTETGVTGDNNRVFNLSLQFAKQNAGWGAAAFLVPFMLVYWRAARKAAVAIERSECKDCKSKVKAQRFIVDPADWWLRSTGNREAKKRNGG